MAGFIDEVEAFARLNGGNIETDEVSKVEFRDVLLPAVVEKFSEMCPRRGEHTVTLVPGSHIYALPDPNIFMIVSHSPVESTNIQYMDLGAGFRRLPITADNRGYDDASIAAYAQELFHDSFIDSVEIIGGQIEVEPMPRGAKTLFLRTYDFWDFSSDPNYNTLPRMYRLGFKYLATSFIAGSFLSDVEKMPKIKICDSFIDRNPQGIRQTYMTYMDLAQGALPSHGIHILEA